MGKAKNSAPPADDNTDIDLRSVLAMEPELRVKFVSKACKLAGDGKVKVGKLYDVLSSRKVINELGEKQGQRLLKNMTQYLWVFSDKQQRYLKEESALATQFTLEPSPKPERTWRNQAPRASSGGEDAASRMEEMMARCRSFVREKAATYDEREREIKEREREAQEQASLEQLAREWAAIDVWHQQIKAFEWASMIDNDERAKQREREADAARKQAEKRKQAASEGRDERKRKRDSADRSSRSPGDHHRRSEASRRERRRAEEASQRAPPGPPPGAPPAQVVGPTPTLSQLLASGSGQPQAAFPVAAPAAVAAVAAPAAGVGLLPSAAAPLPPVGTPLSAVRAPMPAAAPPLQAVGAPLQAMGTPLQAMGTPLQAVGAPLPPVGAPLQAVGAPLRAAVGAPLQAVGAPLQATYPAAGGGQPQVAAYAAAAGWMKDGSMSPQDYFTRQTR